MNLTPSISLRRHAVALAALTLGASAQAALISNGSFEAPVTGDLASATYCYTVSIPSVPFCASVPSWSGEFPIMQSTSSPWQNPSSLAGWDASFGSQQIGLQNNSSISQSLTLVAGQTYQLSWYDAGRSYGDTNQYTVSFAGMALGTFDTSPGQGWGLHTRQFTATGSGDLLFAGQRTTGDGTAFIDQVSLAPVPEPETCAMMLAGLAALAGMGSRRRRKASTVKRANAE